MASVCQCPAALSLLDCELLFECFLFLQRTTAVDGGLSFLFFLFVNVESLHHHLVATLV